VPNPTKVRIPAALIDEFGDLVRLREAAAPGDRRFAKIRDMFKEALAEAGAEEEFTLVGERFTLNISAKSIERKVDINAARRHLGAGLFMKCCSVTMSALSNFLSKPEVEALTFWERTGSRSYVPNARGTV
jgi:hypothetical protein